MPSYVVLKTFDSNAGVIPIGSNVDLSEGMGKDLLSKGIVGMPIKMVIKEIVPKKTSAKKERKSRTSGK